MKADGTKVAATEVVKNDLIDFKHDFQDSVCMGVVHKYPVGITDRGGKDRICKDRICKDLPEPKFIAKRVSGKNPYICQFWDEPF
jgi:hypothetical protein